MELGTGFEPATSSLPRTCSTTELPQRSCRVRAAPIDDDSATIVPTFIAIDGQIRWGKSGPFNQSRIIAIGMPMSTRSTPETQKKLTLKIAIFHPRAEKVSSNFLVRPPSRMPRLFPLDSVRLPKIPARHRAARLCAFGSCDSGVAARLPARLRLAKTGGAGDGIRTRDNQLGRLVFCH